MNEWHDFLVAAADAAAALTGLIFVGVSINLNRIYLFRRWWQRPRLAFSGHHYFLY
jgi:hypothetical protein